MEYELQLYTLNEVRNKLGYETVPYIINENNVLNQKRYFILPV